MPKHLMNFLNYLIPINRSWYLLPLTLMMSIQIPFNDIIFKMPFINSLKHCTTKHSEQFFYRCFCKIMQKWQILRRISPIKVSQA
jgi:hypothetical protein